MNRCFTSCHAVPPHLCSASATRRRPRTSVHLGDRGALATRLPRPVHRYGGPGVSAGSVYAHFASKSDLVVAIFREVCGREVRAVADAGSFGDVVERVTAIVETFAGRAMKNRTLAYALLAEPVDPAVDVERLVFRRAFTDAIAGAISAGIASGDIPEQNVHVTAAGLVGAVGEVLVGPLGPERTPGADVVPDLVAFALRSLGVRHDR